LLKISTEETIIDTVKRRVALDEYGQASFAELTVITSQLFHIETEVIGKTCLF